MAFHRFNEHVIRGGICYSPHLTSKCGTRPFFRWDRAQGRSPHAPGVPKNAYGPFGIPFIRGASGAGRLTQPPSKGGKSLGEGPLRPKENIPVTEPHPARSVTTWNKRKWLEDKITLLYLFGLIYVWSFSLPFSFSIFCFFLISYNTTKNIHHCYFPFFPLLLGIIVVSFPWLGEKLPLA